MPLMAFERAVKSFHLLKLTEKGDKRFQYNLECGHVMLKDFRSKEWHPKTMKCPFCTTEKIGHKIKGVHNA